MESMCSIAISSALTGNSYMQPKSFCDDKDCVQPLASRAADILTRMLKLLHIEYCSVMQQIQHVSSARERDICNIVSSLQRTEPTPTTAGNEISLHRLSTLQAVNELTRLPGNAHSCQSVLKRISSVEVCVNPRVIGA